MRLNLLACLCLISFVSYGQSSTKFVSEILPEISHFLSEHHISATAHASQTGEWVWRFILAEEDLKSKIEPEMAKKLTTFIFTYNQKTNSKKGDIFQAKNGMGKAETLKMIFQQIKRNVLQFGKEMDVLNVEGKLYYIIYFPHSERT